MLNTILIVICVIMLVGMIGMDVFITKDMKKSADNNSTEDNSKKE